MGIHKNTVLSHNKQKQMNVRPSLYVSQSIAGRFSEAKASRGLRHHRVELHQDSRKLPRCRAMMSALCHHGDVAPEPPEGSAPCERPTPAPAVPDKTQVYNKSFISQVPLRVSGLLCLPSTTFSLERDVFQDAGVRHLSQKPPAPKNISRASS